MGRSGAFCLRCGVFIPYATASRKYCDACYKVRQLEQRRKRREKGAESFSSNSVEAKAPTTMRKASMTLEEVVQEMNKENVQYGTYCVKHHLY